MELTSKIFNAELDHGNSNCGEVDCIIRRICGLYLFILNDAVTLVISCKRILCFQPRLRFFSHVKQSFESMWIELPSCVASRAQLTRIRAIGNASRAPASENSHTCFRILFTTFEVSGRRTPRLCLLSTMPFNELRQCLR